MLIARLQRGAGRRAGGEICVGIIDVDRTDGSDAKIPSPARMIRLFLRPACRHGCSPPELTT